jgi:hypothetical protein
LIVTHDGGVLLRHRTSHLLAGFAGRGGVANTDIAIAHDGYPLLKGIPTRKHTQSCTRIILSHSVGPADASVHDYLSPVVTIAPDPATAISH